MGIYLGQLPPAEIARLKAELAETIIANFCYPRFFDYRTESLHMRPVDRAKRQEVWLYLSSVDFTNWGRVDVMSPEFQRQIERLFIQFVQRNRSFFGEQGRKRMSDVRMLIGSSATTVVQGLRTHLSGQRNNGSLPFGSPRSVVSWTATLGKGKNPSPDLTWEQIAASTMLMQQQLQDLRSEVKTPPPTPVKEVRPASPNGAARRIVARPQEVPPTPGKVEQKGASSEQNLTPPAVKAVRPAPPQQQAVAQVRTTTPAEPKTTAPLKPAAQRVVAPVAASAPSVVSSAPSVLSTSAASVPAGAPEQKHIPERDEAPIHPKATAVQTSISSPVQTVSPAPTVDAAPVPRETAIMRVGEDDIAIFEQLRHQMILWLRVESVHSGIEIAGQNPAQLLELLRQQAQLDETRLQVVSTLLNLSNQVITNGHVSVLDYKQALMFHLMHTRR